MDKNDKILEKIIYLYKHHKPINKNLEKEYIKSIIKRNRENNKIVKKYAKFKIA